MTWILGKMNVVSYWSSKGKGHPGKFTAEAHEGSSRSVPPYTHCSVSALNWENGGKEKYGSNGLSMLHTPRKAVIYSLQNIRSSVAFLYTTCIDWLSDWLTDWPISQSGVPEEQMTTELVKKTRLLCTPKYCYWVGLRMSQGTGVCLELDEFSPHQE
jgi:hypothetical protein